MKKSVKLRHQLNYVVPPAKHYTQPSMTVPDMAMSAKEIMIRFSQGRPVSQNSRLHYTGDEFTPDVRMLDLVDKQELLEQNRERISALEQDIKDIKAKRSAAKKQQKLNYQLLMESGNKTTNDTKTKANESDEGANKSDGKGVDSK